MEREKLGSRLGFILLSAGCAIGVGNVWRFPYMAGTYGGGVFVLFYIFFLIVTGIPVMTMELAVGRASKRSIVKSFNELEKPGQKWHLHGLLGMFGNYLLMMFYTVVAGWFLYYFYMMATGKFTGKTASDVKNMYGEMLGKPGVMTLTMVIVVVLGIMVCSAGVKSGVERITKGMMGILLVLMIVLAVNSITMEGGMEGLAFYLLPDFDRMMEIGLWPTIVAAMNQAFFTLSLGIGAMAIFGSYIDKERSLLGEAVNIGLLDTFAAIVAGLIIFPACFAFGVNPDAGSGLVFITLPNVFIEMAGGRIWGTMFFLFMFFASFSTVIAVFENIISCGMDLFGWSRKKTCAVNLVLIIVISMPCVLGFNLWSGFQPLGQNSVVMDLEDFVISNLILPFGALIYLLFCVTKHGWGFENYLKEANEGKGLKMPRWIYGYLKWVMPAIIIFLLVQGLWTKFM